jgi:drug/metabolite transporter (DMT)-like permease
MARIFFFLVIAAIIESVGVAYLSGGLKEIHGVKRASVGEIARVVRDGATNSKIVLGVALEAVFFGILLYMLSKRDVSFVWPLTSLGFIFTTLAAALVLGEKVSAARWIGVLLIALGAGLTGYSEAVKEQKAGAGPPAASAPFGPQ